MYDDYQFLANNRRLLSITITTLEPAILEPITLGQDTNEQIYVGDIKDDDWALRLPPLVQQMAIIVDMTSIASVTTMANIANTIATTMICDEHDCATTMSMYYDYLFWANHPRGLCITITMTNIASAAMIIVHCY